MTERDRRRHEAGAWTRQQHEAAQRLRLAKLPLAEKLAWLEEAHRVVRHLQSQRDDSNVR